MADGAWWIDFSSVVNLRVETLFDAIFFNVETRVTLSSATQPVQDLEPKFHVEYKVVVIQGPRSWTVLRRYQVTSSHLLPAAVSGKLCHILTSSLHRSETAYQSNLDQRSWVLLPPVFSESVSAAKE